MPPSEHELQSQHFRQRKSNFDCLNRCSDVVGEKKNQGFSFSIVQPYLNDTQEGCVPAP